MLLSYVDMMADLSCKLYLLFGLIFIRLKRILANINVRSPLDEPYLAWVFLDHYTASDNYLSTHDNGNKCLTLWLVSRGHRRGSYFPY